MDISYYPGCALHGTSKEYDESIHAVCAALSINLHELDNWCCCGASAAHMTNGELNVALNARNLAIAEKTEWNELLAPCPLCSGVMQKTQKTLADNPEKLDSVRQVIEQPDYRNDARVVNILQVLQKGIGSLRIASNPLKGLKCACYYGCFLVRPPKIVQFDDSENPTSMDDIMTAVGAEPVEWAFKTECCGGGFTMSNSKAVIELAGRILSDAKENGAECIVVACPMCHVNLDMKQSAVADHLGWKDERLPVFYVTQLVGLALGIDVEKLGVKRHLVNAMPLVSRLAREGDARG
ncbi:MAG: CoB--CoM heterodisulfide reductase iron-sulfur subunit B family protein [Candidatus Brocadiia bacterium]